MTKYRQTCYILIIIWVPLCTLSSCLSLHNRKKEAAFTATQITKTFSTPAAFPSSSTQERTSTTQPTQMVTPTPTGQLAPSSTATKIKPPPNATLTASLTPYQKPTATATISGTPPPGWIAFSGFGGDFTGLNIIHTSGKGWRKISNTYFIPYEYTSWSPDGQWIAW
jgi:hypothetical protein